MTTSSADTEPLKALSNWTHEHYGPEFGSSCYYSTECLSNPQYAASWPNVRSWVWQCCSELAYWQVGYPGSIRSQLLTEDYFNSQCKSAFGVGPASTAAFNAKFGAANPNITRVVAMQG